MTVQIPDPGIGNGQTGDNEYVFRKKVKYNFGDYTNAASRLVGTAAGNVMEVGAFGIGGLLPINNARLLKDQHIIGFGSANISSGTLPGDSPDSQIGKILYIGDPAWGSQVWFSYNASKAYFRNKETGAEYETWKEFYHTGNVTKDSNGFLKGASPVVDLYNDKIDLNHDAEKQGVALEKLGLGNYLIKGSLGFAQEGWYIETPKDANGNVLVAVVYEQLPNNDLSIKTYAKKFDDETGDIVANLLKPRDIPTGCFISLRLHELPKEPPVMPTESQPEV